MFEEGGIAYIYIIYGIHNCLNFVTENKNYPAAAVLIRGINILKDDNIIVPGKVCKYLGIDRSCNNKSLLDNTFLCLYENKTPVKIRITKRVGITKNTEVLWRFILDN